MVQRSGRGLSPLTTSRWPGMEGVPATRLWPGGAVPCGTATSRGVPLPPHGNAGSPAPPAQLCTGDIAPPLGHLHDGSPQNTGPTRKCGPASSWSNLAHCKVPRPPRNTPHKEVTSPEVGIHIPTSSRDLPAGCVLGGCSLPQGLPRYSDAVAPPNRSTSRGGSGSALPAPGLAH